MSAPNLRRGEQAAPGEGRRDAAGTCAPPRFGGGGRTAHVPRHLQTAQLRSQRPGPRTPPPKHRWTPQLRTVIQPCPPIPPISPPDPDPSHIRVAILSSHQRCSAWRVHSKLYPHSARTAPWPLLPSPAERAPAPAPVPRQERPHIRDLLDCFVLVRTARHDELGAEQLLPGSVCIVLSTAALSGTPTRRPSNQGRRQLALYYRRPALELSPWAPRHLGRPARFVPAAIFRASLRCFPAATLTGSHPITQA